MNKSMMTQIRTLVCNKQKVAVLLQVMALMKHVFFNIPKQETFTDRCIV